MKHYGLKISEGSEVTNLTAPTGTSFSGLTPNAGELFFRTDSDLLYVHDGTAWNPIGPSDGAANIVVDTFVGNGTKLDYDLSTTPASVDELQVFVGGVYQQKSTYTLVGNTLNFTTAPPNGVGIEVNVLPTSVGGQTVTNSQATATAGQTVFPVAYTVGNIFVYMNGAKLVDGVDYTALDGTDVTLTTGASVGDVLDFDVFGAFQTTDFYTKTESDTRYLVEKNLIINGAFDIWQRATSFTSISGSFGYTADRFIFNANSGTWDVTRSTDVPTTAQAGMQFNYSLDVDCQVTTNPALGDHINVQYRVEGYDYKNVFDQNQTISFWVKSNKTGIYSASLRSAGVDRTYVSEFTINVADTWEKKVITVDTAPTAGGTWDFTNGVGVYLDITLASGPNIQTSSLDQWITANTAVSTNQVNLGDSTSNYLRITGLQLEKGNEATDFEIRPFAEELDLCQRYFQSFVPVGIGGFANGTTIAEGGFMLLTQMRANPTAVMTGTARFHDSTGTIISSSTAINSMTSNTSSFWFRKTGFAGLTSGNSGVVDFNGNAITFDAEL